MNKRDKLNIRAILLGLYSRIGSAEAAIKAYKHPEDEPLTIRTAFEYGMLKRAEDEKEWLERMVGSIKEMMEEE